MVLFHNIQLGVFEIGQDRWCRLAQSLSLSEFPHNSSSSRTVDHGAALEALQKPPWYMYVADVKRLGLPAEAEIDSYKGNRTGLKISCVYTPRSLRPFTRFKAFVSCFSNFMTF